MHPSSSTNIWLGELLTIKRSGSVFFGKFNQDQNEYLGRGEAGVALPEPRSRPIVDSLLEVCEFRKCLKFQGAFEFVVVPKGLEIPKERRTPR